MFHHHIMKANINRASSRRISWSRNDLILVLVFMVVFVAEAKLEAKPSQFFGKSSNMGRYNSTQMSEVLEHLRKINKPAIKSIQSPDGDIIDCVDQHKQLAFDHPLLKNHKIQDPPKMPSILNTTSFGANIGQSWHLNGECPKGTIPVRRISVEYLMRAKSPQHYGEKTRILAESNGPEHAVAFVNGKEYYGAKASINVWAPRVETDEYSKSQIRVMSGPMENPDLTYIAAGWLVYPSLYGDENPRLFTFWVGEANHNTGCYDLMCSGFVQYSRNIAVSSHIQPISTFSGKQFTVTIVIWRDPDKNWWMAVGDERVGYWPAELFTNFDHATSLDWGGEIMNIQPKGQHTSTEMGSGRFAEEGFGKSSFIEKLQTVDDKNFLRDVQDFGTFTTNPNCYNIERPKGFIYYGGPGRNPSCP